MKSWHRNEMSGGSLLRAVGLLLSILVCVPASADIFTFIQVQWDAGESLYRWDYALNPSTDVVVGDYYEIRNMDHIGGALVEYAGSGYKDPIAEDWTATYTWTSVQWEKTSGKVVKANDDYAYFSYYSDWGPPGSLRPWYKNDEYQGDVTAAPEPTTLVLFGLGLAGLAAKLRHKVYRKFTSNPLTPRPERDTL